MSIVGPFFSVRWLLNLHSLWRPVNGHVKISCRPNYVYNQSSCTPCRWSGRCCTSYISSLPAPYSSPSSPVELIMSTRRRSQRAGWADDAESDRSLSLMVIMPPLFLSHSSTVTCQNEGGGASQSRENVNWFDTTAARLNFFHFFPFFVTINFLTQSKHIRRRPKRVYFASPSYLHIGLYCVDFISYSFQVDSRFEMERKKSFSLDCFEQLEFVCRRAVAAQSLFFLNRSPPPTASY